MTKNKKMGRPKLPKAEKRSIMLSTRVNSAEAKQVLDAVKAAKADKTVWLRDAILKAASL